MAELIVTELDFADIKTSLRTYLAAQTEFTDYDFTGSALNTLLDVLAYNTHYNAVLANMQANEMFIDTAIKRTSVISLAKMLGYTPRSRTSAKAYVNIDVPKVNTVGSQLSIDSTVKFTASINGTVYTFNVNEEQTATVSSGIFSFTDVELIEGVGLSNAFTITADLTQGPLVIPVDTLDTTTIEVVVQNSVGDVTTTTWNKTSTIVDITGTSKVFWVEENLDGKYQIVFGDDIIGKALTVGNIVTVSYYASKGPDANGAQTFSLSGTVNGETTATVTTVTPAAGGQEKESIDSVRFNAPKYNATRNRAVTSEDYRSLIKANLAKAREVAVWGGEENDPPQYGKVFISVHPTTGAVFTDADKEYLLESVIRPKSVMSIQHEFVDPEYLYLGFEGIVNYNNKLTSSTSTQMAAAVETEIETYFTNDFGTLDKTFFLYRLTERVKDLNNAIISSVFKMRLQKRLSITLNSSYSATVNMLTAIDPETIYSSNFTTKVSNRNYLGYIRDFSDDSLQNDTGTGTLKFINASTGLPVVNVGTVNYATGIITLNNLFVQSYAGNATKLHLHATPQALYQNISSSLTRTSDISEFAVLAQPAKNTIIVLDDSEVDPSAGISSGLAITALPFSE
jgi:hypothetical protein